jgi:hypothetical protein
MITWAAEPCDSLRMTATERSEGGSAKGGRYSSTRSKSVTSQGNTESNDCSGSTPIAWKWAKIARAPQASQNSGPKGLKWRRLPRRNPRDPLQMTVKLRGGAEQWVEIHARGSIGRYPGYTAIADIVSDLNNT